MMKNFFTLILLCIFAFGYSQNDKTEIRKTVENFFTAMYNADSNALKNTFSETIVFQTIDKNGAVKTEDAQKFAEGISKFSKGDLNEKIKIRKINTDGILASVWMDYQFNFKGKVSHCGVNSFQLVKLNDVWKVQYIIDTRGKCK